MKKEKKIQTRVKQERILLSQIWSHPEQLQTLGGKCGRVAKNMEINKIPLFSASKDDRIYGVISVAPELADWHN